MGKCRKIVDKWNPKTNDLVRTKLKGVISIEQKYNGLEILSGDENGNTVKVGISKKSKSYEKVKPMLKGKHKVKGIMGSRSGNIPIEITQYDPSSLEGIWVSGSDVYRSPLSKYEVRHGKHRMANIHIRKARVLDGKLPKC